MDVLEEIAEALRERMPDRRIETLGPFGLGSETAIHIHDGKETVASISLRPDGNAPGLVMIDQESESPYPEGSIGRLNGLGRRAVPLPRTIDGLVELLRAQERERRS